MTEPNTIIKLYKNVPLDNSYTHSIYFASKSAQNSYFHGSATVVRTLQKNSYQRVTRGKLRIEVKTDDLYECNYMAFQNTNHGNKWFYAFIIGEPTYINEVTSEITYAIDVVQTYLLDCTLLDSYIERCHTTTDEVGDNIVPEPFNFDNFVYDRDSFSTGWFDNLLPVILTSVNIVHGATEPQITKDTRPTPQYITNNPTCINTFVCKGTANLTPLDIASIVLWAIDDKGWIDSVAGVYLIPEEFCGENQIVGGLPIYDLPEGTISKTIDITSYYNTIKTKLGNYYPRNKKLLTYPFKKLVVETFEGMSHEYRYEMFNDTTDIEFKIYANLCTNASFKCVPKNYKGTTENFSEVTVLSNFPLVSYIGDGFKQWWARNGSRTVIQTLGGLYGATGGIGKIIAGSKMLTPKTQVLSKKGAEMMASGYETNIKSVGGTIGSTLSELNSAINIPSTPYGSNDGSLEIAIGNKDFNFVPMSIQEDYAKIIDSYFDMFGYAIKTLATPVLNARPHWTYIQTINCNIKGGAPATALNTLQDIFDNGITFWKNASEVGNYSLDNSV